ncbi:MAG: TIR domain-containing protein [Synechococcus sp.]
MVHSQYDAFINYSAGDGESAMQLAAILKDAGIDIWIDRLNINLGQRWFDVAARALEASRTILVVIGARGLESDWAQTEVSASWAERVRHSDAKTITVLLPGAEPSTLPLFLRTLRYFDLRNWDAAEMDRLIEQLRRMPSVFLCHAKEDQVRVEEIRDFLNDKRIDAWYDKDKLLPGVP